MILLNPDAWDAKPISLLPWSPESNQIPGVLITIMRS